MVYPETEAKVFAIIDQILLQFRIDSAIVFDEKNNTEEYLLAKKMLLDYELVKYILPSEKKKLLVLTSKGAEVVGKGSFANSIAELERQKTLNDKLKFEKIQNDINSHIQSKKLFSAIFILLCIAFALWLIRWATS